MEGISHFEFVLPITFSFGRNALKKLSGYSNKTGQFDGYFKKT
jgi:hypothetical protein